MDLDQSKRDSQKDEEQDLQRAIERIASFQRRRWEIVYRYQQKKRLIDLKAQLNEEYG